MAGAKNKKKGQNIGGKEAPAGHPSTSTSTACFSADTSPPIFRDNDWVLGYFDLADFRLKSKNPRGAFKTMWKACLMHSSHSLLHYWQAGFALEVAHEIFNGINYEREDLLFYLRTAREAAHFATTLSPYDIEFCRLYTEILATEAIFEESSLNEAINKGNQMLNLPEETMVFQERICLTHNKKAIISAIKANNIICSTMEENRDFFHGTTFPLVKPVCFYERMIKLKGKQIGVNSVLPEIEQKKWRRSCWESMSDDRKVEFLALKYEDINTFCLDKHLDRSKDILREVFSISVCEDFMRMPCCFTCNLYYKDHESHLHHVRTEHTFKLSEQLKELLPEEDTCETILPDSYESKLSISYDKANLILHICNGTIGETSFEPEILKSSLPDPEIFVYWLNLDDYVEEQSKDVKVAEDSMFRLLDKNIKELEFLCLEKYETITMKEKALELIECHCLEELMKTDYQRSTVFELFKAVHENLNEKLKNKLPDIISVQYQLDIISDMIKSELASREDTEVILSSDQLEVRMDLVIKSRKELLAKECESIDSKLRKKLTNKKSLEADLSCISLFDYSEHLLPNLGLYVKAQLAEHVLSYATEQTEKLAEQLTMEETKKNASGGSNLSKQFVKNSKKKTKKKNRVSRACDDNEAANQQEGDAELVAKKSLEETTTSFSSILLEDSAVVLSSAITDKDANDSSTTINLVQNDNVDENNLLCQRLLINVIILSLCDLKPFRDEFSMKSLSHKGVESDCIFCELADICVSFGKGSVKEWDASSIPGKFTFSKSVSASYRLQQACYGAPDVLLAIFDCLHEPYTLFGDSSAKLNENTSTSLCWCKNGNCLVHKLFGTSIAEVTTYPCGLEAKRDRDTLFFFATARELYKMKITHAEISFEQILKSTALNSQFVVQSTCGCSKYGSLCQKLLNRPLVFVAVMNWETDDGDDYIFTTFKTISDEINLGVLYDGVQSCSKYFLQSMICCSQKYICFARNLRNYTCFIHDFQHQQWFSYDGESIKEVGDWDAVLFQCITESLQPEVLMYVSEESSHFK